MGFPRTSQIDLNQSLINFLTESYIVYLLNTYCVHIV